MHYRITVVFTLIQSVPLTFLLKVLCSFVQCRQVNMPLQNIMEGRRGWEEAQRHTRLMPLTWYILLATERRYLIESQRLVLDRWCVEVEFKCEGRQKLMAIVAILYHLQWHGCSDSFDIPLKESLMIPPSCAVDYCIRGKQWFQQQSVTVSIITIIVVNRSADKGRARFISTVSNSSQDFSEECCMFAQWCP